MSELLTIAIPTYNRLKHLNQNIDSVLEQLNNECKLLVIDNHSDCIVKDQIENKLQKYSDQNIRVVRNKVNIGLFGNIMRCFELCDTKWLYIIGDDDQISENGIAKILSDIKNHSDYVNITYRWEPEKKWSPKRTFKTVGAINFFESIESIHHIMFLSSNIYNVEKLKDYILHGNYFQITGAPHLAMLFIYLDNNPRSQILLSDNYVVDNLNYQVEEEKKWDKPDFFRNIKLLLDLPLKNENKKALFCLYRKSYPLKKYLRFYLNKAISEGTTKDILQEFNKATFYYKIYGGVITRLTIPFYFLTFIFPKLLKIIWKKIKGR